MIVLGIEVRVVCSHVLVLGSDLKRLRLRFDTIVFFAIRFILCLLRISLGLIFEHERVS